MTNRWFKNKAKKLLVLFAVILNILAVTSFAEGTFVKIGLYYGGAVRDEYSVSAKTDFKVGFTDSGAFSEVFETESDDITVKRDEYWHVFYSEAADKEELKVKTEELLSLGLEVFPVYADGRLKIYGGSFLNENDALWAASNLAATGEAVAPSNSLLCAVDSLTGKVLYAGSEICVGTKEQKLDFTAVVPKEYRGYMLFIPQGEGIAAINFVDREDYLYSVISREMSPSWHVEALKAQAVCARNYVENNKGKHEKYGFDLCDSVCCQAYGGTSAETEGSYPPVDETLGELLMYKGEIAQTFYSSSMGPTTEDVKYVWGSNFPYLTSVENPYEDYENVYNGKWENTLTKARATEIMAAKGYEVGNVTEIKALEYSPSGRVIKLMVKGTKGEKIFERESCRIVFSDVTLSQLYTISGGGAMVYPVVYLKNGDKESSKEAKDMTVLSASGKSSVGESFSVIGEKGKKKYTATKSGDAYVFSGMGWGHGIGMSQYGAKGMAEAGFTYDEILTHYFKGTEIVKTEVSRDEKKDEAAEEIKDGEEENIDEAFETENNEEQEGL